MITSDYDTSDLWIISESSLLSTNTRAVDASPIVPPEICEMLPLLITPPSPQVTAHNDRIPMSSVLKCDTMCHHVCTTTTLPQYNRGARYPYISVARDCCMSACGCRSSGPYAHNVIKITDQQRSYKNANTYTFSHHLLKFDV